MAVADPFTVAIIHHSKAPREHQKGYLLHLLAGKWEKNGVTVHHLFGTKDFIPADIAILHVDLSVIPQHYADFTRQYPITINASLLDIRKRRFSTIEVDKKGDYQKPVIVKTDLNAGGGPERRLRRFTEPKPLYMARNLFRRLARLVGWFAYSDRITSSYQYEIYSKASEVPREVYRDPKLLVEKFLPERFGPWYCHRRYYFLGDAEINQIWFGTRPICANDKDGIFEKTVDPPQELLEFRRKLNIDYGKIDYVLGKDREVIIFDVNKTPWASWFDPIDGLWLSQLVDELEQGIYSFWE